MKINFKKIATVIGSALLIGSTAGFAAAASFPAPFVQSGSADVAVVLGANAALSDAVAATNIGGKLSSALAAQTASGAITSSATVDGEAVSLDTTSSRIWLNTSLNVAKSTLTKTDLPTILGDYTFSGNADSKITSTIKIGAGYASQQTNGANSGKVIFAKQPKSSDEPAVGISLGANSTEMLYNATTTFPAINFAHADSEGETIKLFGRDFVVSTATDLNSLVLFSSAQDISLTIGGASPKPTANVVINGVNHTVELITGSGTTSATIAVDGESKQITSGNSKKINGVDVAVKSVTESTAINTITADILVGSEKITFTNGSQVTKGSEDNPVDGTLCYIAGGPGAATELTVSVFRPDSSTDAILAGQSFVDPVFGSFKVDFADISSPLNSSGRDTITVNSAGDTAMSLTLTDKAGATATIPFVYNSSNTHLGDDSNYSIKIREMTNLTESQYTIIGNEEYGRLVKVRQIYNNTGSDVTNDKVVFADMIDPSTNYSTTFTSEGEGTVDIKGKSYSVAFNGTGDTGYVQVKYPTSDAPNATSLVMFPTIETKSGALVSLYEPQNISLVHIDSSLNNVSTLYFPDGDGYTAVGFTYQGNESNWTIGGVTINTTHANNYTTATIGKLTYNFTTAGAGAVNRTLVYLTNASTSSNTVGYNINTPALVMFEAKDDNTAYNVVVVPVENAAAGTSSDPVGVNDVLFTSATLFSATLQSDSDIEQQVDWYGTLVSSDSNKASQKTATIKNPASQVFSQIFVGANSATISGGSTSSNGAKELGSVTVYDNEITTVQSKNLLVVGGSCINAVAAKVLGKDAAVCGADFTTLTTVGDGQYLIQVLASPYTTGKVAMLVAGYNAADTTKAATYLTNNAVTTTTGTKLKGTSVTDATVVTA